jgi:hypothetical protein
MFCAGRLRKIAEVSGRPWRLGSESNWQSKCLLVIGFSCRGRYRYPLRYPAYSPDCLGYVNTRYTSDAVLSRTRSIPGDYHRLLRSGNWGQI